METFAAHPCRFIANNSAREWLSYLDAIDVSQVSGDALAAQNICFHVAVRVLNLGGPLDLVRAVLSVTLCLDVKNSDFTVVGVVAARPRFLVDHVGNRELFPTLARNHLMRVDTSVEDCLVEQIGIRVGHVNQAAEESLPASTPCWSLLLLCTGCHWKYSVYMAHLHRSHTG